MSDTNRAGSEAVPEPVVATEAVPESVVVAPPTAPVNLNAQAPQMVIAQRQGPGFLARAVWFVLIGWWLTAIVIVIAYVLALSILGLPFAFYLFNRIPAFLTLRGRSKTYEVETMADGRRYHYDPPVKARRSDGNSEQRSSLYEPTRRSRHGETASSRWGRGSTILRESGVSDGPASNGGRSSNRRQTRG